MTDPADTEIDFRAVGFTAEAMQFPRPSLAVAMLAAFNNVSVDQLHAGQRYFPNEHMMRAWERVADTARLTIIAEFEAEIERTIKRNADLDAEIAALKAEVARLAGPTEAINETLDRLAAEYAVAALDVTPAQLDRCAAQLRNLMLMTAVVLAQPYKKRAEAAEARAKELEAGIARLSLAAHMLQQNSEGCALNHYGHDYELFGLPGWLADTAADIAAADALLSPKDKTNG